MEIQQDFRELLAWLNAEVEPLIVGGYAVAHHGARYGGARRGALTPANRAAVMDAFRVDAVEWR